MRKLLMFVLMLIGALSCTSKELPPDDEKTPEVETPVPEPEPEPNPVPVFETSYEAVANMGVGWNLGNTLESVWVGDTDGRDWRRWETGWGQVVTKPELLTMMRDAGFGAIRVPVSWGVHMDAEGKVYDEWMNRVQEVVDYVINAGLYCIINVHHDTGADKDLAWLVASPEAYARNKSIYEGLWRQIAERFRDYDQRLLFESFNEMLDEGRSWCFASLSLGYDETVAKGAYDAINAYNQSFVDVVRATGGNNATRNLVVNTYGACSGSGNWNSHLLDPLKNMKKPADPGDHIIFQVHNYPNIDDLAAMEREVSQMLNDLETFLEPLGGPVIVGEWGTFTDNPTIGNYCHYARYFVSESKKRGIGTFHWMRLSDGAYRAIPCFDDPEITEAIVKGYHGEGFSPIIPSKDDFDFYYKVTYRELWSELQLMSSPIDLSDYKGVRFELEDSPESGSLHVKVYGEEDGMEQYAGFSGTSPYIAFDRSVLGSKARGITLQSLLETGPTIILKRVALIKNDGTEEESIPSVYWGCDMELIAVPKP